MQGCMSPARTESVKRVREGRSLTVKQFQKLLGLMSAASNVIPFSLLLLDSRQEGFPLTGSEHDLSLPA